MDDPKTYLAPTLMALALHAGVVLLLAGSWFDHAQVSHTPRVQHIKAELVDLKSKQQAEQKEQEALKRQQEAQRQAQQRKEAERRKAEQRKAEQQKVAKAKAEQERKSKAAAEQKRQQEVAKRKAEAERQAKLAADKKRKAAEAKAAAKAKAAADRKRQQELANKKAEAERQAKQAAEQKRQEELARQQREQELAQQLAREEQARRAAEQDNQAMASAESVIFAAVSSNWRRPPSARNGMVVTIQIKLVPTGHVDDVYILSSSGDDAFDRSAVNAVWKAERFPELQKIDPVVFDRNLRQITLKFRPEDLRL